MSRGARTFALAATALLALALGMPPSLAQESDETIGPVRMIGPDEVPADPLAMPETLPPLAEGSGLVAYQPEGAGTRHHWLDRPSIAIESPYVRATVVIESSSGARTISHYGFDCAEKALALLATGRSDGSWRRLDSIDWQPVTGKRRQTPYLTAIYRAVCDGGGPTRTVAQMIERLGNPLLDDY